MCCTPRAPTSCQAISSQGRTSACFQRTMTWRRKPGAALGGTARPELLHTYSEERQKIAQQLIDFDREFAKMFSAHPRESGGAGGGGVDPEEFRQYFITQGRFTAGVATKYGPSMITAKTMFQHLA